MGLYEEESLWTVNEPGAEQSASFLACMTEDGPEFIIRMIELLRLPPYPLLLLDFVANGSSMMFSFTSIQENDENASRRLANSTDMNWKLNAIYASSQDARRAE